MYLNKCYFSNASFPGLFFSMLWFHPFCPADINHWRLRQLTIVSEDTIVDASVGGFPTQNKFVFCCAEAQISHSENGKRALTLHNQSINIHARENQLGCCCSLMSYQGMYRKKPEKYSNNTLMNSSRHAKYCQKQKKLSKIKKHFSYFSNSSKI